MVSQLARCFNFSSYSLNLTKAILLILINFVKNKKGLSYGLLHAARGDHLDVVQRLLDAKADVNAAASGGGVGRTALQAAAEGGHLEVIELLKSFGARN